MVTEFRYNETMITDIVSSSRSIFIPLSDPTKRSETSVILKIKLVLPKRCDSWLDTQYTVWHDQPIQHVLRSTPAANLRSEREYLEQTLDREEHSESHVEFVQSFTVLSVRAVFVFIRVVLYGDKQKSKKRNASNNVNNQETLLQ